MNRLFRSFVSFVVLPIVLADYFKSPPLGLFQKFRLAWRIRRNCNKIPTASNWREHLAMAARIFCLPQSVKGCIVECGTFKGGSAANLSLVARMTNRQLEIFDSFCGLPETDERHAVIREQAAHIYSKGTFSGTLAEVKANISCRGHIDVCRFHQGFFGETLPLFSEPCVLVFLDVDLADSLKQCLSALWPLLQDGCYLFTHEAHHREIAQVFFDTDWWASNLGCEAPGLIGAGTGLPLWPTEHGFGSCLGYTVKNAVLEPKAETYPLTPARHWNP